MKEEHAWLSRWAASGDEEALRALTQRYLPMVYGTALRCLVDRNKAEDASVSAFYVLARRSEALRADRSVGVWLWRTTCLVCSQMRGPVRRRRRKSVVTAPLQDMATAVWGDIENSWALIGPELDRALARLPARLRDVLVETFLLGQAADALASAPGIGGAASAARLGAALRRLCVVLARQGVRVRSAALAGLLERKASEPVPAGVARAVSESVSEAASETGSPDLAAAIGAKVMRRLVWGRALRVWAGAALAAAAGLVLVWATRHWFRAKPGPADLSAGRPARGANAFDRKWYPGFYVVAAGDWHYTDGLGPAETEPLIRGLARGYSWRVLEMSEGAYDVLGVHGDVVFAAGVGKRLVVVIQTYGTPRYPPVPDYVLGQNYGGGVYRTRTGNPRAVLWNAQVRARLCALFRALGARYDSDPDIAAVVGPSLTLGQTIPAINAQPGVEPFSATAYLASVRAQMQALRRAFPRTVVMQQFERPAAKEPDFWPEIAALAKETGVGLVCTALDTDRFGRLEHGCRMYPGLAGVVPLGAGAGMGWCTARRADGSPVTPADFLRFARESLKLNYMFWPLGEPVFSEQVLPALRETGNVLEQRRPSCWRHSGRNP